MIVRHNFCNQPFFTLYFSVWEISRRFSPVYQITVRDILRGIEVEIFSSSLSSSFHSLSLYLSLSLSLSLSYLSLPLYISPSTFLSLSFLLSLFSLTFSLAYLMDVFVLVFNSKSPEFKLKTGIKKEKNIN